jgi:hypothetical protein
MKPEQLMKRISSNPLAFVCLSSLAILGSSVCGQEKPLNKLTEQEKVDGWKLLFDGKTMDGWMSWKTKEPLQEGKWKVVDGALTRAEGGGGDIYTAEPFENFEFSVEWKTAGNSGILIRVDPEVKGAIYSVAPEVQIERSQGTKSTSAGGLYALYDIEGEKVLHPDGWNEYRIKMVGGHGVHWMNGKKLYEYTIGSEDWKARVAKSKFRGKVDAFGTKSKGHIGLQEHGAKVAFRNIKIRPLANKESAVSN